MRAVIREKQGYQGGEQVLGMRGGARGENRCLERHSMAHMFTSHRLLSSLPEPPLGLASVEWDRRRKASVPKAYYPYILFVI